MEFLIPTLVERQDGTATSAAPSASNTSDGGKSGGTTPSLFFIVLGVGVVITNLWLIIGIKYCCRHRRRQQAQADAMAEYYPGSEELETMPYAANRPTRPGRRRRRPKRLLTEAQLDEKAPTQKYRDWCSYRKQNGLSTEGGISSATAQAMADGALTTPAADPTNPEKTNTTETVNGDGPTTEEITDVTKVVSETTVKELDESSAPAPAPAPAVAEYDPGDLCAICIDSLEPDDDVRMLPCTHVFHSDCVTPWLTTRRAICPLCKADFYVPSGEENEQAAVEPTQQQQQSMGVAFGMADGMPMYPWEVFVRPPRERAAREHRSLRSYWPFRQQAAEAGTEAPAPAGSEVQAPAPAHVQPPPRTRFWPLQRNNSSNDSPV